MSNFDYIKNTYGVRPFIGQVVVVDGDKGVIVDDCGNYIGVNFDKDKPGHVSRCHPAWRVEYKGVSEIIRKPTKAQLRYKKYLKVGDSFDSFIDFCKHEQSTAKTN